MNPEGQRLEQSREQADWKAWGPYLAERTWGTVREDYSADGNAWDFFPHDQARSRAYRWNEDGLLGVCDRRQILCMALALWNEKDSILKERFFGLNSREGNHGEDVKEYYFYLDSTPTHSYMKALYKYPQGAYPYERLIEENGKRGKDEPEFELLDTGIFEGERYFAGGGGICEGGAGRYFDAGDSDEPWAGGSAAVAFADGVVSEHVELERGGREAADLAGGGNGAGRAAGAREFPR